VLRPAANRGIAALFHRRLQVLRELHGDDFLLDVIVNPIAKTTFQPVSLESRVHFFLEGKLDADKKNIVRRYRRLRPLLVTQGPPGTGKTTLATEIVLQTLSEGSNARILLTAQGHSPLDNLLERLIKEGEDNPRVEKILEQVEIVRVPSGNRSDSEYPERVRKYLPFERADRLFRELRRVSEENQNAIGLPGRVARVLINRLGPYASAPNSLLHRIKESANLVFLTVNSREVERAGPASFDLVLVEEAARCLPMEILGVMRLARRWLLIGDHEQLPPFGFEQVLEEVNKKIESMQEDLRDRHERASGPEDILPRSSAKSDEMAEQRLNEIRNDLPVYMELFRHLHQESVASGALHSTTLKTQWRMHPSLGTMVSEVFYDGGAVCNPANEEEVAELARRLSHNFREPDYLRGKQLVWIDFDPVSEDALCGEYRGPIGELENEAERRTAVAFLRGFISSRQGQDIGILTPYRRQAEQFRHLLRQDRNWFEAFGTLEERISTVDSFQGRQAGIILLSLVRNNAESAANPHAGVGFLADKRRSTVMFSRAERLLVILGCSAHFMNFSETSWIVDIWRRAEKVHWLQLLPPEERSKLEQRTRR